LAPKYLSRPPKYLQNDGATSTPKHRLKDGISPFFKFKKKDELKLIEGEEDTYPQMLVSYRRGSKNGKKNLEKRACERNNEFRI
jgi:hypothetical protein